VITGIFCTVLGQILKLMAVPITATSDADANRNRRPIDRRRRSVISRGIIIAGSRCISHWWWRGRRRLNHIAPGKAGKQQHANNMFFHNVPLILPDYYLMIIKIPCV